jgi:hypothetical protein
LQQRDTVHVPSSHRRVYFVREKLFTMTVLSVGEFFGPNDEELQPFLQGEGPPLPTYFICADEALRRPTLVRRLMCECLRVIILHVSFTKKLQYPRPFRVPAFEVIRNLFRESTYHVSPTRKTYPDNPTYGGLMA